MAVTVQNRKNKKRYEKWIKYILYIGREGELTISKSVLILSCLGKE